jgi:ABC-type glycerol-3-phosphate transport system permease component
MWFAVPIVTVSEIKGLNVMAAITRNRPKSTEFIFTPLLVGWGKILLHITLLGIGAIYIFPFIWMVGSSLKTNAEFFSLGMAPFPAVPQWENLQKAWEGANFSRYFFNTVFISVTVTLLVLLLTSMAGYSIARLRVPGKKYLLIGIGVLFFLPHGYTIIPVIEIVKALGLMNTIWAVIVTSVAGGMLFNTFLFVGYMRTIPVELEEAALIDGASLWQRYWNVALPLAKPMIATVGLFTFMSNWNAFFGPLVFTLGKPELRTLAVGMYAFQGQNSRDWVLMCMGATISILPIILIYILLQRFFIEAFAGAVKN